MMQRYDQWFVLPAATPQADPAWFGFVMTVRNNPDFSRNELTEFLEANRIETRNLFSGNLLRHPAYRDISCRIQGDLANTDLVMKNTFFIGVYPGLEDVHLDYIGNTFKRFMEGERL